MAATAHRDVVAVGASAGGVEALRALAAGLPVDLAATVLVVLHIPARAPSALASILDRSGPLPARPARDGQTPVPGTILVAPPDHHLLLLSGVVRLSRGPQENGHRPAIDPLFRSVAADRGGRSVGVVLSGSRDDGAAGLRAITRAGGAGVVQDPADSLYPSMPSYALESCPSAAAVPAAKLGAAIAELVEEGLSAGWQRGDDVDMREVDRYAVDPEVGMAAMAPLTTDELPGVRPAGFGCPACHGALFELPDAPPVRYRCRVGHAWSAESLLSEQSEELEDALWMALRALKEKAALSERLAEHARSRGSEGVAERYRRSGAEVERAAQALRELIQRVGGAESHPSDLAGWGGR